MRYESKLVAASSDCIFYQSIEDDPDESSLCELDCREHLCTEREWIICRRRLSSAAGESTPHGQTGERLLRLAERS